MDYSENHTSIERFIMSLRPNTHEFVQKLTVETEILNTAKNMDSVLAGVESTIDVHRDHILNQKQYIGVLESGYIGLALISAAYAVIKFRKK